LQFLATLAPYIPETPKFSDKFLIFEDYSGDSDNYIKIVSLSPLSPVMTEHPVHSAKNLGEYNEKRRHVLPEWLIYINLSM